MTTVYTSFADFNAQTVTIEAMTNITRLLGAAFIVNQGIQSRGAA